jgi:maltooligosyltrehalose trehalohydrolase
VALYAPTRLYGRPDDFRRFVDAAHGLGVAVVLDVVYNHLGPDGNYLEVYSDRYFGQATTEWGPAINFDGEGAGPVRELFVTNAAYWIAEFHLDGLRLDATQAIVDRSPEHVVAELARAARAAAPGRRLVLTAESEPQDARLARAPEAGGCGLDALWNDDFHHCARVALTGRREAYYHDYRGTPQELISAVKRGFLYQGQRYAWQDQRRGASTRGLPPRAFVNYLENRDQVANSLRGARLHELASPGRLRALTALLLLGPGTPLLFQGQEFAASTPFCFFADLPAGLQPAMRKGRLQFLRQFPSLAGPEAAAAVPDPTARRTFEACRLDPAERAAHGAALALHRDLLRLRREDPGLQAPAGLDGAVLGPAALVLRVFAAEAAPPGAGDRLLLVNLGEDLPLDPAPEPLLAPPDGAEWVLLWSSEAVVYEGSGVAPVAPDLGGTVPGQAALLFGAYGRGAGVPDLHA